MNSQRPRSSEEMFDHVVSIYRSRRVMQVIPVPVDVELRVARFMRTSPGSGQVLVSSVLLLALVRYRVDDDDEICIEPVTFDGGLQICSTNHAITECDDVILGPDDSVSGVKWGGGTEECPHVYGVIEVAGDGFGFQAILDLKIPQEFTNVNRHASGGGVFRTSSPLAGGGKEFAAIVEATLGRPVNLDPQQRKWQEYERDYILPCFQWAEESGYDLHKAVMENPGHNCVELLVRWLQGRARAAKSFAESLDNIREALGQKETHHLVMAGDVEELVKAADVCSTYGGCRVLAVLRRLRAPPEGPFESYPLTETVCSVCGEPQRMTPGGLSCPQGHGGAEPVTP